jgi:hypothetical protein
MSNTARKIVITALATGGIVAGVATASASPLRTGSPVAATSAEEARLHAEVLGLSDKEQALQTALRARHHATPPTTAAPTASAVSSAGATGGSGQGGVVEPTAAGGGHDAAAGTPPVTSGTEPSEATGVTEPTEPTEATEPESSTTTTVPSTTTTTRVDDEGRHGADD